MDENMTNAENVITEAINRLGATLTVFHRNVKIYHWKYQDKDFITVHPWLDDTVADQLADMIDVVYEQMIKLKVNMIAGFSDMEGLSLISPIKSDVEGFNNEEVFEALLQNIEVLRSLLDKNATIAEENKLYAYHDLMVKLLSDADQLKYFINRSH